MSKLPFVCLNVEDESDVEDDIDNTAEIQLEEALKLYHNALKLHSQGPGAYESTKSAYEDLFRSEIFKYPEALSFRKRYAASITSTSSDDESEESEDDDSHGTDVVPARSSADGVPSTLPQVLYLSFKNFAQFQLDSLCHELKMKGQADCCIDDLDLETKEETLRRASACLESFCDAVDKDDSDPAVWRQMARLSGLLGSSRLTKFCLESVLQKSGDSDMGDSEGLESALARDDLEELYEEFQGLTASSKRRPGRPRVSPEMRKILDPCPGLPTPSRKRNKHDLQERSLITISLKDFSWYGLGHAIIDHCRQDESTSRSFEGMGIGYRIERIEESHQKPESKQGRRRKTTEGTDSRVSVTKPNADEATRDVDEPASPSQSRLAEAPLSPGAERRLPMRTFSTDSARPESIAAAIKTETEGKTERSTSLKRSPDAAGMQQDPPEARSRSKRLRARETGVDEDSISRDLRLQIEKQLKPLADADRHLFSVCDTLLSRVGVSTFGQFDALRDIPSDGSKPFGEDPFAHCMADFKYFLKTWNSNRSSLLNSGTGTGATVTLISKANEAGLASFMEHAKTGQRKTQDAMPFLRHEGLEDFTSFINSEWLSVNDLAFSWITAILRSSSAPVSEQPSRYLDFRWSQPLKRDIHEILTLQDAHIFGNLADALVAWDSDKDAGESKLQLLALADLIQTVFEIQLDMFDSMIKPTSKTDQPTRTLQKSRLQRWTMLASQAVTKLNQTLDAESIDPTSLRHLFSMILYMSLDESSQREHIVAGLHEVKALLRSTKTEQISMPNIDIMPEISVEAVEQEISRLTTTDFFMSVFNPSDDDPVTTIESLEPIIMPMRVADSSSAPGSPSAQLMCEEGPAAVAVSQKDQLQDFLDKSTTSLRLSLWNRLSTAYSAIKYPPMVFICAVRSMDLVLSEIKTPDYLLQPEETRQANLLVWVRNLIDLVDKCVNLTASETTALDALDEENLQLALYTVSQCTKIFHLFALWDDGIRLGQSAPPAQQAGGANSYRQAMTLLRDLQVKTWRLLYILLRDAAKQNKEEFPEVDDDFLTFLAAVHSAIGLREYCKLNKKSFLRFLKPEILALEPSDLNEWRYQMAQLAYDLYDLRVLADSNTWMTLQEHNCPADQLDRATAREILPMVMAQVNAMKLKDITKPDRREFKQAIDEIQDLIGIPKANSPAQLFNRRQLNALQKTPLRTDDLERCLKGQGGFVNRPVINDYTPIAKTGWFFVVGYLRLASFRSVRRQGPDSTKELDEAASFLRVDIDFDCDKWETWYRLAQVYDSMLDEEVAWTTDRINNKMDDLIGLQRQAIHCYQTAVALSIEHADNLAGPHGAQPDELVSTVSELYTDFGVRLYAASRAPFNMEAFSVKDHGRWYYTPMGHKFKAQPYTPTRDAQVWLIASVMFRQALIDRPNDWVNWYMLGKCLWKLLHHPDAGGVSRESVLEAFAKACETAPPKDPRRDGSPTLEPHQKLVSAVHKLVHARGLKDFMRPDEAPQFLDRETGYHFLQRSSYAKKVEFEDPRGSEEWLTFIRGIIKNLRSADKTNWHHRIVRRAADLAYNDGREENPARAALTQLDTIITKNMALTVWRPAFERVGRHFVYTTRYVKLIVDLLHETGDRAKLELLGKRVRKKGAEFIDHQRVWSKICKTQTGLLRKQAHVPELHEEKVLSVLPFEKFAYSAALLQAWAQPAVGAPPDHPLLPVLRELFDLKKLNLNLIPNQGIDDLIGDTYAKLYEEQVPALANTAANEKSREAMRVDRILLGDPDLEEKATASGTEGIALVNPSGRAKIVGRMEVRRRAEALVQRLSPMQETGLQQSAAMADAVANETADEGDAVGAAQSFDVNNDADDESELSELDEDELVGEDDRVDNQEEEDEEMEEVDEEDRDEDQDANHQPDADERAEDGAMDTEEAGLEAGSEDP